MSCRELERLFISGADESESARHRQNCAECERLGADLDRAASLSAALRPPVWSPALRRRLLDIPRSTVSCEAADALLASLVEGEIAADDQARLRSHLSRCGACTEAAATLQSMRSLASPEPPPWLSARLGAARPEKKKRSLWRSAFSGRMVVVYAYAAALVVMLLGLNPTAVVRRAGFAGLGESTRHAVTVAESSIGDRLGALQEKAVRELAVLRGRVGGYGRAAVSNAFALVWRPEPRRTPRPRLGKDGGTAAAPGGVSMAAGRREELSALFLRV